MSSWRAPERSLVVTITARGVDARVKRILGVSFSGEVGQERGEPEVKALREDENLLVLRSYECCSEHLNG